MLHSSWYWLFINYEHPWISEYYKYGIFLKSNVCFPQNEKRIRQLPRNIIKLLQAFNAQLHYEYNYELEFLVPNWQL
jgi:hypothetical protein